MSSPVKHFPPGKLKKLSKTRMKALRAELKRAIKKDPMMRGVVTASRQMSKILKKTVGKRFRELS
jgi:hypothetical protein